MIYVSQILIQHHEIESFAELLVTVKRYAESGERFLNIDIKPEFEDTPHDWAEKIEAAFY